MALADVLQGIAKEGFDPRKDSANGPTAIPAGTYPVLLKDVQFRISEKGWESISYNFEVRGGDYDGRQEFARFGTLEEWNGKSLSWAIDRTMKFYIKALALAGDHTQGDESDGKDMETNLKRKAVGTFYNLIITENKGKNGQAYRQYDLEEANNTSVSEPEFDESNLPF